APLPQQRVVAAEIVGFEEDEDSAAGLVAHARELLLADRARQQKRRTAPARRGHPHPTPATPQMRALHQLEHELLDVERDRLVVVADGDGDLRDSLRHHALLLRDALASSSATESPDATRPRAP